MSTTLTVRLDESLKARLEKLAASTQRSKSFLAAEALRDYVELNEWQVQEVQDALNEADTGDFADDKEVRAAFVQWQRRAD